MDFFHLQVAQAAIGFVIDYQQFTEKTCQEDIREHAGHSAGQAPVQVSISILVGYVQSSCILCLQARLCNMVALCAGAVGADTLDGEFDML